jgi:hypothetical protein
MFEDAFDFCSAEYGPAIADCLESYCLTQEVYYISDCNVRSDIDFFHRGSLCIM